MLLGPVAIKELMHVFRSHWQLIKTTIGENSFSGRTFKIFALLIESGTIYCLFWVCFRLVLVAV